MNGVIADLKNLLLGPPGGIVEGGDRSLRMAQITDCVEQQPLGFDERLVVADRQRSNHAG